MSGILKSVGKLFKKVVKTVKKVLPIAAMAAAIYFTAGLGAAAFAPASGLASMPGIPAAASFFGIGGGAAAAGAATASAAAPTFSAAAATSFGTPTAASVFGASASSILAPASSIIPSVTAFSTGAAAAAGGAAGAGLFSSLTSKLGSMSFADKLALGSMGTNALGAFMAPTAKEIARDNAIESKKWRGSFYGQDAAGGGFTADEAPLFGETAAPAPSSQFAPKPIDFSTQFTGQSMSVTDAVRPPRADSPSFDLFQGIEMPKIQSPRLRTNG